MSNVVVNELEIKVQSTASGALSSLTKVMNKLDNLQKKMDSFSSKKVVSELGKIDSSLGTNATKNIDNLANALKKLPSNIKGMSSAFTSSQASIMTTTAKLHAFTHVAGIVARAVKNIAQSIGKWVTESMDYVETLNLFNVTMGQFAEEATEYAEQVESIMGINISDWMNAQAVFMALGTGFGVASEKAYLMSKNLTQLGYDLSSFYNIKTADAMEKLQAGISGELEPLRRLGFDLSMAKLQEIALANGINQRVESMTQAEKAQLRYIAIMQQSVNAQGDMARTLNAPANQLRILQANAQSAARALGNIFIPALNAILPAAIVALQAIRMIADAIAALFGFSIPEVDYGGAFGGVSSGASDAEEAIDGATGAAKKFKQATLGFDELNVIAPQDSGGGGGAGGGGGGGYDFPLPEYDFLAEMVKSKIQEMMDKLLEFYDLVQEKVPETAFDYIRHSWERLKESFGEFKDAWKNLFDGTSPKDIFAQILADIETTFLNWAGNILTYFGAIFDFGAGGINLFDGITDMLGDMFRGEFDANKFIKDTMPQMAQGFGQLIDGAIKAAFLVFDFAGVFSMLLLPALQGIDWLALAMGFEIDMDGWWLGIKDAILNVDFSALLGGVGDKFGRWLADDINSGVKAQGDIIVNNFLQQLNNVWNAIFGGDAKPFGEIEIGSGWLIDLFNNVATALTPIFEILTPVQEAFTTLGTTIASLGPIFGETFTTFGDLFVTAWDIAAPILDAMNSGFNVVSVLMGVVGIVVADLAIQFSVAFTAIGNILNYWMNVVKNVVSAVQGVFEGLNMFVKGVFTNDWQMAWNGVKTAFLSIIESMVNSAIALVNGMIATIESAVNSVISAINSLSGLDIKSADWGRIDDVDLTSDIPRRASGGFVNTGELFIANEAGPELVGSIGSRTAVANNDQIVSGIAAGVYSAMSAALADNATSDGNINITVKIDSDVIYKKTEEKKRQRGYNMGMGAFAQ